MRSSTRCNNQSQIGVYANNAEENIKKSRSENLLELVEFCIRHGICVLCFRIGTTFDFG